MSAPAVARAVRLQLSPAVSAQLDALRALAAFAVFFGHSCILFAATPAGGLWMPWRAASRFGHQAVIVFFVLSGYLVGGGVVRRARAGCWSWRDYGLHRFSRLYVVLLPALAACALWDRLGVHLAGDGGIYGGSLPIFLNWPVASRWGAKVLLGNALFLQSRWVRPFGSDVPLWSLAFEFWYYVAFPLLFLACGPGRAIGRRVAYLGLAAAALYLGGRDVIRDFPTWLLGVVVYGIEAPRVGSVRLWKWLAAIATAAAGYVLCHPFLANWWSDWVLALASAVVIYVIIHDGLPALGPRAARVARHLAKHSYTLYLVHLPVLVFAAALLVGRGQWPLDGRHLALWLPVFLAVWAYAEGIAYLFESRTVSLRSWLDRHFPGKEAASPL